MRELVFEAVAVEATSREAGMPMDERVVKFVDGQVLPTWNWIAEPAGGR